MNFLRPTSTNDAQTDDDAPRAVDYLRSHSVDEMADDVRGKVDDMAADVRDKADAVAGTVRDKADEVGTQTSATLNGVMSSTGQQVTNLGHAIRKHTSKNRITNATANTLERSGQSIQDQDVAGMRSGLKKTIERYPLVAFLIAAGLGFVLVRKLFFR